MSEDKRIAELEALLNSEDDRVVHIRPDGSVSPYSTEYIKSLHGEPTWEAIWRTIKGWDISRTGAGSYHAPTGDDATAIYEAVKAAQR